jgi:hypothetical protein
LNLGYPIIVVEGSDFCTQILQMKSEDDPEEEYEEVLE